MAEARHIPVMLEEVLERLAPVAGEKYIDATFGAGGYTRAILESCDCEVWALDRDPSAVVAGYGMTHEFDPRLSLWHCPFGKLAEQVVDPERAPEIVGLYDGIVFDLGVSSMQLDNPERGFSFQADGPLDMRMFASPGQPTIEDRPSAADIVNTFHVNDIADILFQLGDERRSRAIAAAILARRVQEEFRRTSDLIDVVTKVLGRGKIDGRHPATRTFQALRIYVNDEIGELVHGLMASQHLLKPGGRLVVVTFHSLEDRVVKRFFALTSGKQSQGSRHAPAPLQPESDASFQIVNHPSLTSSKDETDVNPRARSARLRSGVRTAAKAMVIDPEQLGVPQIVRKGQNS